MSRREGSEMQNAAEAITLVVLALGLLAAGTAGAKEIPLRYTLDPTGPPVNTPGQRMRISDTPPPAMKLPRFVSPKPIFLTARLGEGADPSYTFALEETAGGAGYDRLYVDS